MTVWFMQLNRRLQKENFSYVTHPVLSRHHVHFFIKLCLKHSTIRNCEHTWFQMQSEEQKINWSKIYGWRVHSFFRLNFDSKRMTFWLYCHHGWDMGVTHKPDSKRQSTELTHTSMMSKKLLISNSNQAGTFYSENIYCLVPRPDTKIASTMTGNM